MVGTEKLNSTWAWRLPLMLQIIPPLIVMTCVLFCPESPRWLISRGRIDEARKVLVDYHSNDGKTNAVIEVRFDCFGKSNYHAEMLIPATTSRISRRHRSRQERLGVGLQASVCYKECQMEDTLPGPHGK